MATGNVHFKFVVIKADTTRLMREFARLVFIPKGHG